MIKSQTVWNVISVYLAYGLYLLSGDKERLVLVIVLIGFLLYLLWNLTSKKMVEALGIIIDRCPKGKPRKLESQTIVK